MSETSKRGKTPEYTEGYMDAMLDLYVLQIKVRRWQRVAFAVIGVNVLLLAFRAWEWLA